MVRKLSVKRSKNVKKANSRKKSVKYSKNVKKSVKRRSRNMRKKVLKGGCMTEPECEIATGRSCSDTEGKGCYTEK